MEMVSNVVGPDGKSIRENNLLLGHEIPIGTLVEINQLGLRLFVIGYERDCDGEPLYVLSFDTKLPSHRMRFEDHPFDDRILDAMDRAAVIGGFSASSLVIIREA